MALFYFGNTMFAEVFMLLFSYLVDIDNEIDCYININVELNFIIVFLVVQKNQLNIQSNEMLLRGFLIGDEVV